MASPSSATVVVPKALKASVILFPGQGSQYVGMVKDLTRKGKTLFEMANHTLGYDLLSLCQNGPGAELNKTVHSQPAVFVTSLAAVERLAEMSVGAVEKCKATAGFSVGEFAALVLGQSIGFVDALKVLKLRAEATQEICEQVPSGMMTVIAGRAGKISQACFMAREYCVRTGLTPEESECGISNHLFPHAKVVGGHTKALEFIETNSKDFGIKKIKRLAVSGAFHTRLMRPAAEKIQKVLKTIEVKDPKIKIYSNADGRPYQSADQIRKSLVKHVYLPVMWEQTIQNLYSDLRSGDELPVTFECGPQNNLTTMLGMINLTAKKLSYNIELS